VKTDNIKTNLEKELKFIVEGLCNTVGCNQCLYNHKCRAVELENKIFKIEEHENKN